MADKPEMRPVPKIGRYLLTEKERLWLKEAKRDGVDWKNIQDAGEKFEAANRLWEEIHGVYANPRHRLNQDMKFVTMKAAKRETAELMNRSLRETLEAKDDFVPVDEGGLPVLPWATGGGYKTTRKKIRRKATRKKSRRKKRTKKRTKRRRS